MSPRRPLGAVNVGLPAEDLPALAEQISDVLRDGPFILGPHTETFEKEFARYIGAPFAVATSNGTAALEIAFRIAGVDGREVVMTTNTNIATPVAALNAGAIVRFIDMDPATLSISLESVRNAVTRRTAAVVVVHIGGFVTPEIDDIRAFCARRGIRLIEDAAHAHGTTLEGRHAGTFGDLAAFSFYPTKVMTSVEGGMLILHSAREAKLARMHRDHGKREPWVNRHYVWGNSWRISEVHALVGISQLRRLPRMLAERRRVGAVYRKALAGTALEIVDVPGNDPNYYKFVAILPRDGRDAVKQELLEVHSVALSGEVYLLPCHRQPVLRGSIDRVHLPRADRFCRRHVCLPVHPSITDDQALRIASALTGVMDAKGRR
ncbi:MAG TPA: DegT/DnrJ/EryC1/StrS family aminotransferase [Thermoanaerobaculia bacterium]